MSEHSNDSYGELLEVRVWASLRVRVPPHLQCHQLQKPMQIYMVVTQEISPQGSGKGRVIIAKYTQKKKTLLSWGKSGLDFYAGWGKNIPPSNLSVSPRKRKQSTGIRASRKWIGNATTRQGESGHGGKKLYHWGNTQVTPGPTDRIAKTET